MDGIEIIFIDEETLTEEELQEDFYEPEYEGI